MAAKNKIRRSFGGRVADVLIYVCMISLAAITLFPILNVAAKALSSENAVLAGKVGILPVGFQLSTLGYVVGQDQFLVSLRNSVLLTVFGTLLALLTSTLAAYPMSKRNLPGMKFFMFLFVFTMMFAGGMIPTYIVYKEYGILNSWGSLLFPQLLNVFNLLLIKNYFESVSPSLEEAARIDGAGNMTILFRIILPLAKPVLATVALYYAVAYWNDYMNALMYITKPALKPLQLYLYEIVTFASNAAEGLNMSDDALLNVTSESVRSATIIASTVPILVVYPWLQNYFVKGVMIGSVKE